MFISFYIQTINATVTLHLVKNHHIDLNVPIVIGNSNEELNLPKIKVCFALCYRSCPRLSYSADG